MQIDVPKGTDDNGGISYVEGWPTVPGKMKIEKIDDMSAEETVDRVSDYAAGDQAEADLVERLLHAKLVPKSGYQDEDENRKTDEKPGKSLEHSPRRSIIDGINEIKEPGYDFHPSEGWIKAEGKTRKFNNDPLRNLVAEEDREEDEPKASGHLKGTGHRSDPVPFSCPRHRPQN